MQLGPAPHKITPVMAEVNFGDCVEFTCHAVHYKSRGLYVSPSWIFENSLYIDGIAEKKGLQSILIESANLTHNGQYTCVGYKRSKLRKILFLATAQLLVFGKSLTGWGEGGREYEE